MELDLDALEALEKKATPGPWGWWIEDASMANLSGPDNLLDLVMSVSPCRSCSEGEEEWKWGRCTTPSKENADFISALRNAFPEILRRLREGPSTALVYFVAKAFSDGYFDGEQLKDEVHAWLLKHAESISEGLTIGEVIAEMLDAARKERT